MLVNWGKKSKLKSMLVNTYFQTLRPIICQHSQPMRSYILLSLFSIKDIKIDPYRWLLQYSDVIMGAMASHGEHHECLLNRSFRRRSKKQTKPPRHWPLCGEFTVTGEFPAQMASNAENCSIWWRHHLICSTGHRPLTRNRSSVRISCSGLDASVDCGDQYSLQIWS